MSTFQERKAARTETHRRFEFGWKLRDCGACAGSGRYDHNGSPPCGACDGSGKERYRESPVPEKLPEVILKEAAQAASRAAKKQRRNERRAARVHQPASGTSP